MSLRKIGVAAITALIIILVLIQLVPYGRDHSNPSVRAEPRWDSPRTRELASRVCFDCHSNEVNWPWYSHIAPMSWLVQRDVDNGRDKVNYSDWDRDQDGDESAETVQDGEMPPWNYTLAHPDTRLNDAERDELIQGLIATFGSDDNDDD